MELKWLTWEHKTYEGQSTNYSRVICQKSSEQKTPALLVCREPETSIAIWPVVSLLFSASQSDCLFVSAAFQDDDLSKNVLVFSRKGVSFNRPNYLRRSIEKWTASLSLKLTHCLTSKKNSVSEQSVQPCILRCYLFYDCMERIHCSVKYSSDSRAGSRSN